MSYLLYCISGLIFKEASKPLPSIFFYIDLWGGSTPVVLRGYSRLRDHTVQINAEVPICNACTPSLWISSWSLLYSLDLLVLQISPFATPSSSCYIFFSFLPILVSGPYPVVVLRNYSWLSVLRGPYEVLGIEPKLAACKARALPLILIYFCPHFLSFKKISYFVGGGGHGWGAWELYPTLQGLLLAVLRRPWCVKIKLRSPEKKIRALWAVFLALHFCSCWKTFIY